MGRLDILMKDTLNKYTVKPVLGRYPTEMSVDARVVTLDRFTGRNQGNMVATIVFTISYLKQLKCTFHKQLRIYHDLDISKVCFGCPLTQFHFSVNQCLHKGPLSSPLKLPRL